MPDSRYALAVVGVFRLGFKLDGSSGGMKLKRNHSESDGNA